MRRSASILLILFLLSDPSSGDTINPQSFNYSSVDVIILKLPKSKFTTMSALSDYINTTFGTSHERLRAIFRWVTNNIEYSYETQNMRLEEVFKRRKGVCSGYAELISILSDKSGIPCRTINGWAKNDPNFNGVNSEANGHAWNLVTLYGKDYLLEPTWAAGYFQSNNRWFTKNYVEGFFLADPGLFILQHYPEQEKDQLLDPPVSLTEFLNTPSVSISVVTFRITDIFPRKALIKAREREDVDFRFSSEKNISRITIALSYKNAPNPWYRTVPFTKNGNVYTCTYTFDKPGDYSLTVYLNDESAFYYKASVSW